MIYTFSNLSKKMDSWDFPKIDPKTGFRIIRTDFRKEFQKGNIHFEDDGVYLERGGRKYRGYMYMPTYRVEKYGYPKFHLVKCKTIEEFIDKKLFNSFYLWSNSETNDITDRDHRTIEKNVTLELCGYCKKKIYESINDTEDFFSAIGSEIVNDTEVEVDINGYKKDWQLISRNYQSKVNHTCEKCGIIMTDRFDHRFLHTHHIDGNKLNNNDSNLKCLCALCHSNVDSTHSNNFNKSRMQIIIQAFINKYQAELKQVKNPYLVK